MLKYKMKIGFKRRMMMRIYEHPVDERVQSYLGMLKHGNAFKTREEIFGFCRLKR
jgi:hypothetical protein